MVRPSPEEQQRLQAEKARKKAEKKAKYDNQNIPTVEIRIPWLWCNEPANKSIAGKAISDEMVASLADAQEQGWRTSQWLRGKPHDGPVKRRIIRT